MAKPLNRTGRPYVPGDGPFESTADSYQIMPALPVLAKLVYSLDDEVLIDACWAISYLSDGANDKIQAVIEAGIPRRLVELLMHASTSVQTPALRSVGNIVTGDDVQTQIIINCGALPALLSLLGSSKDGIRKEACWTISNVTAGNSTQIQAVIDAQIIPPLVHLLTNGDFKTRKEACWAISNATSGGLSNQSKFAISLNRAASNHCANCCLALITKLFKSRLMDWRIS